MSADPNQLVIIINILKPLSTGRGPMKSMLMLSKQWSGTGKGYRSLIDLEVVSLLYRYCEHDRIYELLRLCHICGQK